MLDGAKPLLHEFAALEASEFEHDPVSPWLRYALRELVDAAAPSAPRADASGLTTGWKRETVSPMRTGAHGLLDDLLSARHVLLSARHETYYRLLGILLTLLSGPGADPALMATFERVWRTRSFPSFYERPLLVLAALRADALQEGATHPLYRALAAPTPDPSVLTAETLASALGWDRLGIWSTITARRVQTNEPSRAVAWLWPAYLAGCSAHRRPLALFDIGAAAGLNLVADQLPPIWTERASGKAITCATRLDCLARIGFEPRPLSVHNADDLLWMRACVWAGDTERLSRFEASVQALRGAGKNGAPPVIERLTASLVPERIEVLAAPLPKTALLLCYQTLLAGYLAPTELEHYRAGMTGLLLRQPPGRAVWIELEIDDARRRLPALLLAHVQVAGSVKSLRLARSTQHPTELDVEALSVAELTRHLAASSS